MVLFELAGSGNFGSNRCTPPEDDKPSNFHVAPKAAEGYEDCGSDGKGLAEDCGIAVRGPGSEGKFGKDELAMILGGVHAAEEVFGFLVGVPSSSSGRLIGVPNSGSGRVAVTGSVQPGKGPCLPPCPRGKGLPAAGSLPPTAGASLRIALQKAASMGARAPGGLSALSVAMVCVVLVVSVGGVLVLSRLPRFGLRGAG